MCVFEHFGVISMYDLCLRYIHFLCVMIYLVKPECYAHKTCLKVLKGLQIVASKELVVVILYVSVCFYCPALICYLKFDLLILYICIFT